MDHQMKILLAASAATLLFACAKKAEEATTAETAAPEAATAAPDTDAVETTELAAGRPAPIGSATVTIGLNAANNNAPYFSAAGAGYCIPGGGCAGGIVKDTGDVDLSGFPPGDVTVTVSLDDASYTAGYRFPASPFDSIGIATWPVGQSTEPPDFTPMFGANAWPRQDFQPPSVSGDKRSVTFLDEESAEDSYQYAIQLDGPAGRVLLDPRIQNGGGQPPLPEPVNP
ncbi:MAG: hypothetical protein AB7F91_06025 [Parvularculaceae bacterium]